MNEIIQSKYKDHSLEVFDAEAFNAAKKVGSDLPVDNLFSDGIYLRILHIPKDCVAVGHVHTTNHFAILLTGELIFMVNGEVRRFKAGDIVEGKAGTRKYCYALEDSRLLNPHPTDLKDVELIKQQFIDESAVEKDKVNIMNDMSKIKGLIERLELTS